MFIFTFCSQVFLYGCLCNQRNVQSPASRVQRPDSRVQRPASRIQHPECSVKSPESRVQSSASRVQSPASSVQRPEPSVQILASRVQRPESSVQSPAFSVQVQRPESSVQLLRPKSRNSGMPSNLISIEAMLKNAVSGKKHLHELQKKKVQNKFKDINKDTRTTSLTLFWCFYSYFSTKFKASSRFLLLTLIR